MAWVVLGEVRLIHFFWVMEEAEQSRLDQASYAASLFSAIFDDTVQKFWKCDQFPISYLTYEIVFYISKLAPIGLKFLKMCQISPIYKSRQSKQCP